MKKRFISVLLACIMFLSAVPALPAAEEIQEAPSLNNAAAEKEYDIFDGLEILKHLIKMITLTDFEKEVYKLTDNKGVPSIFDVLEILKNLIGMEKHARRMPNFPPAEKGGAATQKAGGVWTQLENNNWKAPAGWDKGNVLVWTPEKAGLPWTEVSPGVFNPDGGSVTTTPPDIACNAIGCDGKCDEPVVPDHGTILPKATGVTANFRNLTAKQLTSEIRAGWNLGNTLDAYAKGGNPLPGHAIIPGIEMTLSRVRDIETQWAPGESQIPGQSSAKSANETRQSLIKEVKRNGFNGIRIPVTWFKVVDPDDNWKIHPAFMARVKTIVDWAIEEDMYVILNTHHEEYIMPISTIDKDDPDYIPGVRTTPAPISAEDELLAKTTVKVLWEQICETFKDYNEKLIFEGINEPRTVLSDNEWIGGFAFERRMINDLHQIFVDTVRASGGNNRYRVLMVPTYAASSRAEAFGVLTPGEFKIPTDIPENTTNGVSHKIALSIHAYLPGPFALNGSQKTFNINRTQDTGPILQAFNQVNSNAARLGVPVVLGEWGSPNQSNTDDRALHARYYVNEARKLGFVTFWWDNGIILPPHNIANPEHTFALFTRQPVPYLDNITTHVTNFLELPKITNSIICAAGRAERPKVPAPLGSAIEGNSLVYGTSHTISNTAVASAYTIFDTLEILKHLIKMTTLTDFEKEVFNLTDNKGTPSIFDALEILKSLVGMVSHERRIPNFPPSEKGGAAVENAGGVWTELENGHYQPPKNWNPEKHWNPENTDLGWVKFEDGTWGMPAAAHTTREVQPSETVIPAASNTVVPRTNAVAEVTSASVAAVTVTSGGAGTTTHLITTAALPATVYNQTTISSSSAATAPATTAVYVNTTVSTAATTVAPAVSTASPVATTISPAAATTVLSTTATVPATNAVIATTATTAVQGNVLYDMQTDSADNLSSLSKRSTIAGFLYSTGSSGTVITVNTANPRTITVTDRGGTSQGIHINVDEIAAVAKSGYSYLIEFSGRFPNNPAAVARIRTEPDTDKVTLAASAAVNGNFTVSVIRTAAEIKADSAIRYSLGNDSGNIDIIYTGIRIVELPASGLSTSAPSAATTANANITTNAVTVAPSTTTSKAVETTAATTTTRAATVAATTTTKAAATTTAATGFTITFNWNFAGAPANQTAVTRSAGTLPTDTFKDIEKNMPVRSGYTFVGWYDTTSSSGGTEIKDSSSGTVFTKNTTVYARWSQVSSSSISATLTAQQLVGRMGTGWNLGNTFDASNGNSYSAHTSRSVQQMETDWIGGTSGGNATTQNLIKAIKAAGFDTIRIPVSWFKVADPNNNYAIRPEWMTRIKQVVDWAYSENMYIILNTHHEENVIKFESTSQTDASVTYLTRIWTQIATTFNNNYNERLIFEGLNEPHNAGSSLRYGGGTKTERQNLNKLNQAFVTAVRATGGNNANRILMVPTYYASAQSNVPGWNDGGAFDSFTKP
ncbi:MAG: cellulase family glycosylhydrolase, partial [Oscillospiraceae bacterium]|nr:cellulase family glycosylhydrolase [Oscillospiraceae bacterium]